ncbi:uncharacterized protein LOC131850927 [Achroia grisella]|uniref:uncharacterized protein LOC131850927 n=1 Tax=Achroia grisella TaxID=688607 RepID=UPI0027D2AEF8|nr:uncharacterized protein LOC131850927 [Achroia grisella]
MTTFGEISEPISRSAWEDWDEIIPGTDLIELHWQQDIGIIKEVGTLIILEGKYLSDIVNTHIKSNLEFVNSIKEVNLSLFKSEDNLICFIKDYNLILSSDIVHILKPYLSIAQNVITILTKSLSEYQSSEYFNKDCIVRTIHTTKPSKFIKYNFPKLEQPNLISGVSAGVISLREHLGQSGVAVVSYIEYAEDYQIETIQSLLKELDILQSGHTKPSNVLNSNLYV